MFDRPTRLFLRWRDRGDAAALAELFDRAAPELLRLALHLCRHAADAEDVLQATFLAAIESAQRFQRSHRVLPWLTGPLPERFSRKAVCVVQIAALIALMAPVVMPPVSTLIAAGATGALVWSFAVDAVWRWRQE